MKAFIEEYGTTCVVVLVIVTLIAIVGALKPTIEQYYEDIVEDFFKQAEIDSTTSSIS